MNMTIDNIMELTAKEGKLKSRDEYKHIIGNMKFVNNETGFNPKIVLGNFLLIIESVENPDEYYKKLLEEKPSSDGKIIGSNFIKYCIAFKSFFKWGKTRKPNEEDEEEVFNFTFPNGIILEPKLNLN